MGDEGNQISWKEIQTDRINKNGIAIIICRVNRIKYTALINQDINQIYNKHYKPQMCNHPNNTYNFKNDYNIKINKLKLIAKGIKLLKILSDSYKPKQLN